MIQNELEMIGRTNPLFRDDIGKYRSELAGLVEQSRFLVIGGAGSIGQAVVKELFARNPRVLHVVDISENNMVELVRDIRSSYGYIAGDFRTFALDCGSREFEAMFKTHGPYDYIFNLSALKHVRSEKDPYTLMRMVWVNIMNTIKTINLAAEREVRKYFCVSTDKAANPVNMMGASKRIMEMFLLAKSGMVDISTARFANVAFSDGSLLHGFRRRLEKMQPIAAPTDVRRYFVVGKEAGQLCLLSGLLGENGDIFFPKLSAELNLVTFSSIAEKFLRAQGLEPVPCETEEEARASVDTLAKENRWPCFFFTSDTTGEKDFEEFYTRDEKIDLDRFVSVGIVKNNHAARKEALDAFLKGINGLKTGGSWTKKDILDLFYLLLPDFDHYETGKYLDNRM